MTVSSDAILVYGMSWENDIRLFPDDVMASSWPEVIAAKRGIETPFRPGFRELDYPVRVGWMESHRKEIDAWRNALLAIEAEFPLEIFYHGSQDLRCPVIAIKGRKIEAARGQVRTVVPGTLYNLTDSAWDSKIRSFAETLGIDTAEAKGPAWLLLSWLG